MVLGRREVKLTSEITIGNVASIITTLIAVGGLVFYTGQTLANIMERVANLETSDRKQNELVSERIKLNDARWEAARREQAETFARVAREQLEANAKIARDQADVSTRVTRLETKFDFIVDGIRDIKDEFRKLNQRAP